MDWMLALGSKTEQCLAIDRKPRPIAIGLFIYGFIVNQSHLVSRRFYYGVTASFTKEQKINDINLRQIVQLQNLNGKFFAITISRMDHSNNLEHFF